MFDNWKALRQEMVDAVDEEERNTKDKIEKLGRATYSEEHSTQDEAYFGVDFNEAASGELFDDMYLRSNSDGSEYRVFLETRPDGHFASTAEALDRTTSYTLVRKVKADFYHGQLAERVPGIISPGLALDFINRRLSGGPPIGSDQALNEQQLEGFSDILAPGVSVLWGPPGTGKTKVISAALQHILAMGKTALLLSHTNVAVDNALEKLVSDLGPALFDGEALRVGRFDKISARVTGHPFLWVGHIEDRDEKEAAKYAAQVVACTLVSLQFHPTLLTRPPFDYVIIDEASAAMPVDVLFAAMRTDTSLAMIGDFCQNGPVLPLTSMSASYLNSTPVFSMLGLTSVQETRKAARTARSGVRALTMQYRFGSRVATLANDAVYEGMLETPPDREEGKIKFYNVANVPQGDSTISRSSSGQSKWWQVGTRVAMYSIDRWLASGYAESVRHSVAVVSPYKEQAKITEQALREAGYPPTITSGTAHTLQGSERELVIFDLTESQESPGWLTSGMPDAQRVYNVAITRTKGPLVVIGDRDYVCQQTDGPLASLGKMIRAGQVKVVDASDHYSDMPLPWVLVQRLTGAPVALKQVMAPVIHKYDVRILDRATFDCDLPAILASAKHKVQLYTPINEDALDWLSPTITALLARGAQVEMYNTKTDQSRGAVRRKLDTLSRKGLVLGYRTKFAGCLIVDERDIYSGEANVLATGGLSQKPAFAVSSESLASRLHIHLTIATASKKSTGCAPTPAGTEQAES